jgi:hypothetical protein
LEVGQHLNGYIITTFKFRDKPLNSNQRKDEAYFSKVSESNQCNQRECTGCHHRSCAGVTCQSDVENIASTRHQREKIRPNNRMVASNP